MIADRSPIIVEDGVMVWCFAGPDMCALTDNETGQGLPADLGPWTPRKHLTVDGTNPDEAEALRLIQEHGFCCFDLISSEAEA